MRIAAQELSEEIPDCRITVVDSLAASLGEGLLVHKALEKQKAGLSYDEMVKLAGGKQAEDLPQFIQWMTCSTSTRGGRVSKAAAVLGTMINLKPGAACG